MSPLQPTPKGEHLFDWLAPDLRRLYKKIGRRVTEYQLRLEIERRWGNQIVERVCRPKGMSSFQCLVLAAIEARSPEPTSPEPPA